MVPGVAYINQSINQSIDQTLKEVNNQQINL